MLGPVEITPLGRLRRQAMNSTLHSRYCLRGDLSESESDESLNTTHPGSALEDGILRLSEVGNAQETVDSSDSTLNTWSMTGSRLEPKSETFLFDSRYDLFSPERLCSDNPFCLCFSWLPTRMLKIKNKTSIKRRISYFSHPRKTFFVRIPIWTVMTIKKTELCFFLRVVFYVDWLLNFIIFSLEMTIEWGSILVLA